MKKITTLIFFISLPSLSACDNHTAWKIYGYLKGHKDKVSSLNFSKDTTKIVSGSHDKTVKIWDIQTTKEIHSFTCKEPVFNVNLSPDNNYVAISYCPNLGYSLKEKVVIVDIREKKLRARFVNSEGPDFSLINSLTFSDDNQFLYLNDCNDLYTYQVDLEKVPESYDGPFWIIDGIIYIERVPFVQGVRKPKLIDNKPGELSFLYTPGYCEQLIAIKDPFNNLAGAEFFPRSISSNDKLFALSSGDEIIKIWENPDKMWLATVNERARVSSK